jgi:hypothetical protein
MKVFQAMMIMMSLNNIFSRIIKTKIIIIIVATTIVKKIKQIRLFRIRRIIIAHLTLCFLIRIISQSLLISINKSIILVVQKKKK